jgi:RNA polymerase sigma factor (sigma-70 family)
MPDNKDKALQQLYLAHNRELNHFLSRRVSEQEVADLLQETWLHFIKLADTDAVRTPRSFLYKIAANVAIDYGRKVKRSSQFTVEEQDFDQLPSPLPAPDAVVEQTWQFERFAEVLQELPELRRQAFIMNKMEGMTHAEIALKLGISEKSVQRTIMKAFNHCILRLAT